jgi:hypothetical protein
MCPACPKVYWYPVTHPMTHGLVETVTLTCLSTNNRYHLPIVSLSSNLPWVSPSYNPPCVIPFPDIPGADLSIRDNKFLTMIGASQSRHAPTNSWLNTDNPSTFLHLPICHTNSWLHTDKPSTFLQLNYNQWQTKVHNSHPSCTHMHQPHPQWQQCAGPHLQQPQIAGPVMV